MPDESPIPVPYCSFWLGRRLFGVSVRWVKEVHAPVAITPVPGAPSAVRGYVNLRGNLYLVLDPRELLTGESPPVNGSGQLIVFKAAAGETFAIETDSVGQIVAIQAEQIDVPGPHGDRPDARPRDREQLVTGHAKLNDALMTIVEPSEFLPAVFQGSQSA